MGMFFIYGGTDEIEAMEGKLNGGKFHEILGRNRQKSTSSLTIGSDFTFQQVIRNTQPMQLTMGLRKTQLMF